MRLVEKCIEIFGQSLPFGVAECGKLSSSQSQTPILMAVFPYILLGRAFGATLKPSEYPLR